MRIQHNITAMNAYRNYTNNTSALAKNLEKLSSGYKINRAGDNAAGLAISEKMRAQITGLEQAQANAKDGISLVQTAEGALTEVHDMLNRMVSLAEQSANGTYDNEVDRVQLQKELDQLRTEINRIADSANFNGINLLDGTMEVKSAGSKSVSVKGIDRLITSTMSNGEKAYQVVGNKTVFDSTVKDNPQKGSFKLNLNNINATYMGTKATDTAKFNVTLTVGDWSATVTASLSSLSNTNTVVQNSDITKAVTDAVTKKYSTITMNGIQWKITNVGNSLQFDMKAVPENADQAQTNFDVNVNFSSIETYTDSNSKQHNKVNFYQSEPAGTVTVTPAISAADKNLANTVFKLTADDIVDGARIKLGTSVTLVLAVGPNSTTQANTGETRVDLTSMDPDKVDLNYALSRISQSVSGGFTTKYNYVTSNGSTAQATVNFDVTVSDGSNGQAVGLNIQRTDAVASTAPAYFNTLDRLGELFSLEYIDRWDATNGLTLQIGDTADSFNQMKVDVKDCHTSSLGVADIDISTQSGAQEAIDVIKDAINYVSDVRGTLGATQNRLDHTINNLSVMRENIQDAESTIRDVDIAEEMMAYTKNSILVQSAQAMLAQANQLPQGVLQLLQ